MKTQSTIAVLALALCCALGQSNRAARPPQGDYYSWQHPEWPPLPGPLDTNLAVYRLAQTNLAAATNYLVDDRSVQYPPPERPTLKSLGLDDNDITYLRHPGRIRDLEKLAAKLGQSEGYGPARAAEVLEKIAKLRAAAKYYPRAPYTEEEESRMNGDVIMAEACRTNRAAVESGPVEVERSGGGALWFHVPNNTPEISAMAIRKIERQGALARIALDSTNRADVEAWLAVFLTTPDKLR